MKTSQPSAIKSVKAWAIVDIQEQEPRWTYRMVQGKKSGLSVYFNKPKLPDGFKRKKRIIRVQIVPL